MLANLINCSKPVHEASEDPITVSTNVDSVAEL